jgi:uncharacterized protein (TIGR02186 family)
MRAALLVAVLALVMCMGVGEAEELAAGISRDKVEINSSFTGTDVVVFGAIESEVGESIADGSRRDIVVVIRSDKSSVATVRKKERVGPIWINRETRQFAGIPGFYFVASSRVLKDIAAMGTNTIDIYPGTNFGDRQASRIRARLQHLDACLADVKQRVGLTKQRKHG